MKTLQLSGGDLVVTGRAGHQTITGLAKIRQDLALALAEPYGDDRFHPQWGSVLPNYVGTPISADTEMLVRSEVARVIQAYIGVQQNEVVNDALVGNRTRYSTADVVAEVTDIATAISWDTLRVKVTLRTVSNQSISITRSIAL
jgi:phage baseplate assembly protein W